MSDKPQVVIHCDDIGMCHGANVAFADLFGRGLCTSGAVMVPCPWFLEIADMQAKNPRLDIGVHLVLTSEWQQYRWRPLTGASQASGLVDNDGYFWRTAQETRAHAHPDAVEAELRAQVGAAKTAGIDITHIDGHMFTVLCPQYIDIYARLGTEERVPVLLVRQDAVYSNMERGPAVDSVIAAADKAGRPVFERVLETPWKHGADLEADYEALLARVGPGLNYMALHFNASGDIEAIAPHEEGLRPAEYALFSRGLPRDRLAAKGAELMGMRAIRDRMRAGTSARVA